MNEPQIFNNPEFGEVRTLVIDDEPYFIGKDVSNALGYTNPQKALRDHVAEEDRTVNESFTVNGTMGVLINESGLYSLILSSKMPNAKRFKRWVTGEILPSIRKHGAYMTDETLEKALLSPDFLIRVAEQLKEEKEQREKAEAQLEANAPLVLFAETVQASPESILIGELSKMLKQRGIDMGQKRLFAWLRDNGYLMRRGEAKNQPTQYSMERKLFELKKGTYTDSSGDVHVKTTTKVTAKGQIYFVNLFLKEQALTQTAEGAKQ